MWLSGLTKVWCGEGYCRVAVITRSLGCRGITKFYSKATCTYIYIDLSNIIINIVFRYNYIIIACTKLIWQFITWGSCLFDEAKDCCGDLAIWLCDFTLMDLFGIWNELIVIPVSLRFRAACCSACAICCNVQLKKIVNSQTCIADWSMRMTVAVSLRNCESRIIYFEKDCRRRAKIAFGHGLLWWVIKLNATSFGFEPQCWEPIQKISFPINHLCWVKLPSFPVIPRI